MAKNNILKLLLFVVVPLILLFGVVSLILLYSAPTPQISEVDVVANETSNQVSNNKIVSENKFESDKKLQAETDSLLTLFDKNMRTVPVFVRDEPILKTGTESQQRVAYTICENKTNPTIFVKKVFYREANNIQLTNILKHELTHAYFCRQGIQAGHDARFRQKFTAVGGFGN